MVVVVVGDGAGVSVGEFVPGVVAAMGSDAQEASRNRTNGRTRLDMDLLFSGAPPRKGHLLSMLHGSRTSARAGLRDITALARAQTSPYRAESSTSMAVTLRAKPLGSSSGDPSESSAWS